MSWDALFSLQGHSPYILAAYGGAALLIAVELAMLWRAARRPPTGGDDGDA
ncbi:heme exporter protein CcmD [Bordetella bronchiseptica]|uniref:heme exporter protein CcmD n=1 Tax=Bordetella bronchiseptica TaxID=518 RepID=UPI00028FE30E|nr:heme exporter protein CcmD [Bordetella bronchiseptica]KDD53303.1 hypothetical protein L533_2989 [Bordetella bronchiseptica OSU553]AZW30952.1 heme exporter protein CcmD [Bordetella bronchiseptica]KAK72894.1 hypothetical protein L530_2717 [Bordetella bronchiseptica MO211]KCV43369.1 hypothetical protein L572_2937 [Bordetella bronchiseptica 345]KCV50807.1 hypothetical protein L492_2802 [Bordetella bronchiseptica 7E71]